MSRRDHKMNKSMLIGGNEALDRWAVSPVAVPEDGAKLEEPFWWQLPDGDLVALFRDNAGSKRLYRAFSTDQGATWTTPVRTNFPDATSKFNALCTSQGFYVLVSNANPTGRNPLCVSVSRDGLVFTGMARLPLPDRGTYQYPHVLEHDGAIYIVFSRDKRAIEVLRVQLSDLARMLPRQE
jgi:predicted neuraminidase